MATRKRRLHKRRKTKRNKHNKGNKRNKGRQTGGDYRIATVTSMENVALPRKAGVSIGSRSGVFSVEEAIAYKARRLDGERD
jgi:hypothetical protein